MKNIFQFVFQMHYCEKIRPAHFIDNIHVTCFRCIIPRDGPKDADLTFDPTFMEDISKWLLTQGNNIIYIYGENDPWSAPHLEYLGATNAKMFWVFNMAQRQ